MKFFDTVQLGLSRLIGERSYDIYEHTPEILLGFGITTMVGSLVASSVAGYKLDNVLEDHINRIAEAKKEASVIDSETGEKVPQDDVIKKKVFKEYAKTVGKVTVLYAPAAALGTLSIISFVQMHNIQCDRIASATAWGLGIKQSFDTYRKNNIALNGVENDKMCMNGFKDIPVKDEQGNVVDTKKVAKEKLEDGPDSQTGEYNDVVLIFGRSTSTEYDGNPYMDRMMIEQTQRAIQDLFHIRHWVLENDVRSALGMEETIEGMENGWYDDGKSDIPILDIDDEMWLANKNFLNGERNCTVYIKLNTHGNVRLLRKEALKRAKEARKI